MLRVRFLVLLFFLATPAWAEPFLDLGVGVTFFIPTVSDGTWKQEAFPHHFDTRDLALRAGLGWRFNERWHTTVSYVRLGSVGSTTLAVADENYDPNTHRCLAHCSTHVRVDATDRLQGGEWSLTRTFEGGPVAPFLRAGGALLFHSLHATAGAGHEDFSGRIPMILVSGGLCYQWICAEATYYYGIGSGSMGFPISTRMIVPMATVQIPLW